MMLTVIKKQISNEYHGPHFQLEYQQCWDSKLNNPLLHSLYKESVCYTERWYLEIRRIIENELWHHPLLHSIVSDNKLRYELVKSTVIDGNRTRSIVITDDSPAYKISAEVNYRKLIKWCAFFVSIPDSHETLVSLNARSPD